MVTATMMEGHERLWECTGGVPVPTLLAVYQGRLPEGEDAYVGSRRWSRNECYWDFIVRRERLSNRREYGSLEKL